VPESMGNPSVRVTLTGNITLIIAKRC